MSYNLGFGGLIQRAAIFSLPFILTWIPIGQRSLKKIQRRFLRTEFASWYNIREKENASFFLNIFSCFVYELSRLKYILLWLLYIQDNSSLLKFPKVTSQGRLYLLSIVKKQNDFWITKLLSLQYFKAPSFTIQVYRQMLKLMNNTDKPSKLMPVMNEALNGVLIVLLSVQ